MTREIMKAAAGRIKNGDLPKFRLMSEKSNFMKRSENKTKKEMKKMWNTGNDVVNGNRMFPNVAQKKNMRKITIEINVLLNMLILRSQSVPTEKIQTCQL